MDFHLSHISPFSLILGHKDCQYCGKTFWGGNAKKNIDCHLKKHEKVERTKYQCQFCYKVYKDNVKILRHQRQSCSKIDLKSLNALKNKK